MKDYLIVETDNNLIRDLDSNAIINKNKDEFEAFLKLSQEKYKEKKQFENLKSDVDNIKNDILEIKNLLLQMIKN